jgi:general secretion pathway protein D
VEEEEATDFPRGFGLDRSTGPGGTPFGTSNQVGSYGQTGRYGRDSVLRRSTMGRGRYGGSRTRVMDSERVIDETLTPDQIERLEERGTTDGAVTAEDLRGISRRDPTIYVTVNRQHNLIVVRTSDTLAMKEIAKLVAELDRPTPQVLLEMKILALTLGDSFRSIFDIEYTGGASSGGPETATPTNPLLPGQDTAPRSVLGSGNFDLEESTLVYQFLNDNVRARLQLLATDNRVDILATPIVLASNNRPARMFVGEERVLTVGISTDVITSATGPTTTAIAPITEIRDIGNTVLIVPKINADRTVTLMLVQDTSTVSEDSSNIPVPSGDGGVEDYPVDTVNTANLQATVVAKDGMTLAVGGLIRVELVDDLEKVPVLGDIPVVKFFFRKKVARRTKTELILLITPRVLFTPTEADEATRERLKANSDHPWVKQGDEAYRTDIDDLKRELDDEFKKEKKKKEEEQEDLEEAREEQETTK